MKDVAKVVIFLCAVPSWDIRPALAYEWMAGCASVAITPQTPVHLAGYDRRQTPFEAVEIDIFAKALALQDSSGNRGAIVTSDLLFVNDAIFATVCDRIQNRTGIRRNQLILNASHNHTAPVVSLAPLLTGSLAYGPLSAREAGRVADYTNWLQDQCVTLVERAVADLKPARLSWGTSRVSFPMNRRSGTSGSIRMKPNPQGNVDRSVPVLRIASLDGELRCVLFGCACHNTTLTPDHNVITGDYAGYAQQALERELEGVQAMFLSGCGADANPEPRGSIDVARKHGAELATAVRRVLDGPMRPITGPLHTAYEVAELPLMKLDTSQLESIVARGRVAATMAEHMLRVRERGGALRESYPAPFAVWTLGDGLTLVALPGEGVAGYADVIRRQLGARNIWISSYNNDCFGYLPTAQIVREGGHEAIGITVWLWGVNLDREVGFFTEDVERTVLEAVARLVPAPPPSNQAPSKTTDK